jgi:uncharacterized protein YkwD
MPALLRRSMPLVFAGLLLMPAAVPVAATTSDPSISAAEEVARTDANLERIAHGRVPLRLDTRVQAIAHERAETMADADELSHNQADGKNVFDILTADGIRWYAAGEIIAWNQTSGPTSSAHMAIDQWMASSGHREILLSTGYNYVGFGMAVSSISGRTYWAGVFIKGPDRSGAWAKLYTPTKHYWSATRTKVTFHWTGGDVQLQVLTAGLRYFETQRRVVGGEWASYGMTTGTWFSTSWARGASYEFRVRAVDRVGNWGPWKTVTVSL